MQSIARLKDRVDKLLAAQVPLRRTPHLAVIMAGDPDAEEKRRAAAVVGDPILEVELFNGEAQP